MLSLNAKFKGCLEVNKKSRLFNQITNGVCRLISTK